MYAEQPGRKLCARRSESQEALLPDARPSGAASLVTAWISCRMQALWALLFLSYVRHLQMLLEREWEWKYKALFRRIERQWGEEIHSGSKWKASASHLECGKLCLPKITQWWETELKDISGKCVVDRWMHHVFSKLAWWTELPGINVQEHILRFHSRQTELKSLG